MNCTYVSVYSVYPTASLTERSILLPLRPNTIKCMYQQMCTCSVCTYVLIMYVCATLSVPWDQNISIQKEWRKIWNQPTTLNKCGESKYWIRSAWNILLRKIGFSVGNFRDMIHVILTKFPWFWVPDFHFFFNRNTTFYTLYGIRR